jgi:dihydrofolate reductase/thymidylate synthase
MDFNIIMACDEKYGIGNNSTESSILSIPWKLEKDMKFFKTMTTSIDTDDIGTDNMGRIDKILCRRKYINAVIMGRKTADTLLSPLPNRLNVVISSNPDYRSDEDFIVYGSLDSALNSLAKISDVRKVFVIGGAQLYEEALMHERCRTIYCSHINKDYHCDVMLTRKCINKLKHINVIDTWKENDSCKYTNTPIIITTNVHKKYNSDEAKYLELLDRIIRYGDHRETRNAKTYSLFGSTLEFNLSRGDFPLLTSKKMFYRGIFEELIFFLKGQTDTKILEERKVMIWHDNTTKEFIKNNNKKLEEYDMGPMYGFQWRHFGAPYIGCTKDGSYKGKGIDQLENVINLLVDDPHSRRIMMTTFNPQQVDDGVLHPCHGIVVQFYVEPLIRMDRSDQDDVDNSERYMISLQMYQRSADSVLGVPFNIASYAVLLHVIVNLVNNNSRRKHLADYLPGRIIMVFGDVHIYQQHIEVAKEQIKRIHSTYRFPHFKINKNLKSLDDLNGLTIDDFVISDYISCPPLKAKMIA